MHVQSTPARRRPQPGNDKPQAISQIGLTNRQSAPTRWAQVVAVWRVKAQLVQQVVQRHNLSGWVGGEQCELLATAQEICWGAVLCKRLVRQESACGHRPSSPPALESGLRGQSRGHTAPQPLSALRHSGRQM